MVKTIPSYSDASEPVARRPFSDWISNKHSANHVHPIYDDGRLLPFLVVIPNEQYVDFERHSFALICKLQEMEISFNKWSSALFYDDGVGLAFYFSQQKDVAIFKLLWDGV